MVLHLEMRDFAIATFAVDPRRVAELLPHSFEPRTFTLRDRSEVALVSAVMFRNTGLIVNGYRVPAPYRQTNYRTYVTRAGEPCVWFFGSALSTPAVWMPELLLGMPWHRTPTRLSAQWNGPACTQYEVRARDAFGDEEFACTSDGHVADDLDGFVDAAEGLEVLTQPLSGFMMRRNGSLMALAVEHDRLQPAAGVASVAHFSFLEDLALVHHDAKPHSVLLVEETTFRVFAPRFY